MDGVKQFFSGLFCLALISVLSLLGIVITLNLTLLNPDFTLTALKEFDVYTLMTKQVESLLEGYGVSASDEASFAEFEPRFEQEVEAIVRSIYDSLHKGESGMIITLTGIKEVMKDYVAREMSSLPELPGVIGGDIEAVVSRIYSDIDGMMPDKVLLDESVFGLGTIPHLDLISRVPGYIRTVHQTLAVLGIVLVLSLCLVHWWQPKPIVRALGIVFLTVGVGCVASSFAGLLGNVLFGSLLAPSTTYMQLQPGLLRLFSDMLKPMRLYGFGFLGAGFCLMIMSLLWRSVPTTSRIVATQGLPPA
jgi:hypothetical protein